MYQWAISQKLQVNKFECIEDTSEFNEDVIKNCNEGYFLEVDVQYPEKLHGLHNDLQFLSERMKIKKVEKLVIVLHDKSEYIIHIINLEQALNHGLVLKKVHRVIKLNQKAWLKQYIDMNFKIRQKAKNNLEKDLYKLVNNAVFEEVMENVKNHRNIKFVKTERRRNYLVSEPNYHTTKFCTESLFT